MVILLALAFMFHIVIPNFDTEGVNLVNIGEPVNV